MEMDDTNEDILLGALEDTIGPYISEEGVNIVGLGDMFIQMYREACNPSIQDWEDMQVNIKNVGIMFDELIKQEMDKLRDEESS